MPAKTYKGALTTTVVARTVGSMVRHSSLEQKAQGSLPSAAALRACMYLISIYVKHFLVFGRL